MTGDRSLRDYDLESGDDAVIDDPLVFLAQPDSIILSKEFADRNHIAVGGRLPLGTVEGEKQFTVRGIMKSSGLTSAFGGNLAIMDIYAAQKMFGRGRTFDRIDLARQAGPHDRGRAAASSRALLGPGFQVEPPSGRGQQFEAMLAAYSMMVEHLEPVRAVHRDVHHLQLVRDCGDAAALGDRHPARARRDARPDPLAVPRRERGHRPDRLARRARRSAC